MTETPHFVPRRRTAESAEWGAWDWLLYRLGRLKPLWWTAGLFLIALGFDFRTPAAHFQAIETRIARQDTTIDSVRNSSQRDIADVKHDHEELRRYIRALAIAQCLDRPRRETQLMGLPCTQLLSHTSMDRN